MQGVIQAPHNASGKVSEINDLSELRFLEVIKDLLIYSLILRVVQSSKYLINGLE